MSLVGVRAQNHRQQTLLRGAKDSVDERWTPDRIFAPLHAEHTFTLDVAANSRNAKCARFFDLASDGLSQLWRGEVVWCNPPYSSIRPWVEKALDEVANGCPKVVLLLPANRTEQPWWQALIEPSRDRGLGVETRFLPGRINFAWPENPQGKSKTSAPFGCVVVVIEPRLGAP